MAAFDTYAAMLAEWQGRMNLVGPSTLPNVWERHFADSAQLLPLAARGASWLDIGAGAGFPGIAIALLDPSARVTLVESTGKKCDFLRAVAEATGIADRVAIAQQRIESMPATRFDIVTARACAALSQIFDWGLRFADDATRWLLLKGARAGDELAEARTRFAFDVDLIPSRTDPDARIVAAAHVRRK